MKKYFIFLYTLGLAYLTIEIVARRILWDQAPIQLSPWLVYSLVLLNFLILAYLAWAWRSSRRTNSGTVDQ